MIASYVQRSLSVMACCVLLLICSSPTLGFRPNQQRVSARHISNLPAQEMVLRRAKDDTTEKDSQDKELNPVAKSTWYAVEAFGKAFGPKSSEAGVATPSGRLDLAKPPGSLKETLERIQLDNDRSYFLSGEVDKLIYEEECVFADPFVSFAGRDRFVENLANLGSFITNYSARLINYEIVDDTTVNTKIMVKLELNLPWKPVLAWPWGVTYELDPDTYLVKRHEESWDIDPWEGVKQIFRKPTVAIK